MIVFFLAISAIASQNIFYSMIHARSEKQKLYIARVLVVIAASISYVIAISADGFYQLVQVASSIGTAGVLVVTLIGLWTSWGRVWAAGLALVTGLVFLPIAEHVFNLQAPFLSTILAAGISFAIGSVIDAILSRERGSFVAPESEPGSYSIGGASSL
ncbi:MAG: hypothetical protein K2Q26_12700 [Bdellovibrionales bacterium]|nr:hypothetical protein [Bdellovibrionales bacterium]